MQAIHSVEEAVKPPNIHAGHRADWTFGQMAGRSPVMQRLFSQMRHTARHLRIATIEGEAGTGKLLAARSLHEFGLGPDSPFVPYAAAQVCEVPSSISPVSNRSLPEATFSAHPAIEQACSGTLVLSHVDELSHIHQARLLELLEWIDHQHILGALDSIPRQILCLSSRPLRRIASTGSLRADLVSRLTAIRFTLAPLRQRRDDIPILADLFAQRFSATHGKPVHGIGPQALPRLMQYAWPGNVRELESAINSAALCCQSQWIRPIDLPAFSTPPDPASGATRSTASDDDPNLDRAILRHIQNVLARVEGNKLRAAKMLGISRSTLYRLLDSPGAY